MPAPRSSTGAACTASSDGGEVSCTTLAWTDADAPRALPDRSSTAAGAADTESAPAPDAPSSDDTSAFWAGVIANRTDCEAPSVMTRAPSSPTDMLPGGACRTDRADALAAAGSTNSSSRTRTVPAARSTAAPARTGGAPSGTRPIAYAAAPSNAR